MGLREKYIYGTWDLGLGIDIWDLRILGWLTYGPQVSKLALYWTRVAGMSLPAGLLTPQSNESSLKPAISSANHSRCLLSFVQSWVEAACC